MPEFFPLIIVAVVALIAVGAYLSHLAAKKRMEAMGTLARELGWRFEASKDSLHDDQYAHFEIFRRGHSRVAFNTMEGELEILQGLATGEKVITEGHQKVGPGSLVRPLDRSAGQTGLSQ